MSKIFVASNNKKLTFCILFVDYPLVFDRNGAYSADKNTFFYQSGLVM